MFGFFFFKNMKLVYLLYFMQFEIKLRKGTTDLKILAKALLFHSIVLGVVLSMLKKALWVFSVHMNRWHFSLFLDMVNLFKEVFFDASISLVLGVFLYVTHCASIWRNHYVFIRMFLRKRGLDANKHERTSHWTHT